MDATVRAVGQALARMHDLPYLQTHPLAGEIGGGKALQRCLFDALEALGGRGAHEGRAHRLLVLRYREGLEPAAVQRELGLAKSQYYQEHGRAVAAVASLLEGGRRAVAAPSPARGNLPAELTSFVGRGAEVATVADLLVKARLVTLVGVGGCGKTRLARAVAARARGSYPDGVWLVELAPLSDPSLLPKSIAVALGVHEQPGQPIRESLVASLRSRRLMLLLDNCEHLIADCAGLTEELLLACPGLVVLATSREALGVPGEVAWRVPSLGTPGPAGLAAERDDPVALLLASEAAQLFCQRARSAEPGFAATAKNAAAIAEICWRLDGIPLALELAAGRIKVLSVEQVAARLDDRFGLLTGGSRTALPRQQTLRATLDWSHNLLSDPERAVLRRASVFAGGFALEAAEAVCGFTAVAPDQVLDLISQLADKSLVVVDRLGGETRYRLLETVRQYGHERLVEAGEAEAARDRLAEWCLALAERAEAGLTGPEQPDWLRRLEPELDNLRAALTWSQRRTSGVELRLAGSMWRFWRMRSYYAEGRAWLEGALGREPEGSAARAKALLGAGILAYEEGDTPNALAMLEESAAWWRQAGAKAQLGHTLHDLGICLFRAGQDVERTRAAWDESLVLLREVGDERGVACSLWFLGGLAARTQEHARGRALLDEAVQLFRGVGDAWGLSQVLALLGTVLLVQRDVPGARRAEEEALEIARRLGSRWGIAAALRNLARVTASEGDPESAGGLLLESARIFQEIGSPVVQNVLCDLGALAVRRGVHARGVRLLGAGASGRAWIGAVLDGRDARADAVEDSPAEAMESEWQSSLDAARASLGLECFDEAWSEGRAMTREQAIAFALEGEGDG